MILKLKTVRNIEAPLEHGFREGKPVGIRDPANPVSALCLYLYQSQNFISNSLFEAQRLKIHDKVENLGPFAAAFFQVIEWAQHKRRDKNKKKYSKRDLYRGTRMT